jgi:preprotein translocase subunit SecG
MTFVLDIVQVFVSVMLVFLVLMHSGKDAGLSGFGVGGGGGGGTGSSPFGGGSLVERNLNRWTVLFAILFGVNTIVLIKVG